MSSTYSGDNTDSRRYTSAPYPSSYGSYPPPSYPSYPSYPPAPYSSYSYPPAVPAAPSSRYNAAPSTYQSYGGSSRSTPSSSSSWGRNASSNFGGGSSHTGGSSTYGASSRAGGTSTSSYSRGGDYDPSEPTDDYTKATFQAEEKPVDYTKEGDLFSDTSNTGINFSKYGDIPVTVTGDNAPPAINSFGEARLHKLLLDNITRAKYTIPTPVQKYSIPIAGSGRDLMACAQTGSGKTAAFLLPVINDLTQAGYYAKPSRTRQTPEALIVAPTRELASQIHLQALKFCYQTGLRSVVCYGGSPPQIQARELESGCNILVGTPGRLIDMYERGKISFASIKFLVLDEADRMLDMGFEKDIRQIVLGKDMPSRRQTLMFSATFPKEIRQLASDFLRDYLFLKVGRVGSTTESITQVLKLLKPYEKQAEIVRELRDVPGKTLVFAETKRDTDNLARYLFSQGFSASGIHGDRTQKEREAALRSFKAGKLNVLVATDVAARGLDIDDVTHVINYALPANIDSYVHRIGRTGRAGNVGRATSFFTEANKGLAKSIVKILREANQVVPDWLDKFAMEFQGKMGGGPVRSWGRGGGGARYAPYGASSTQHGGAAGGYGGTAGYGGSSGYGAGYR